MQNLYDQTSALVLQRLDLEGGFVEQAIVKEQDLPDSIARFNGFNRLNSDLHSVTVLVSPSKTSKYYGRILTFFEFWI